VGLAEPNQEHEQPSGAAIGRLPSAATEGDGFFHVEGIEMNDSSILTPGNYQEVVKRAINELPPDISASVGWRVENESRMVVTVAVLPVVSEDTNENQESEQCEIPLELRPMQESGLVFAHGNDDDDVLCIDHPSEFFGEISFGLKLRETEPACLIDAVQNAVLESLYCGGAISLVGKNDDGTYVRDDGTVVCNTHGNPISRGCNEDEEDLFDDDEDEDMFEDDEDMDQPLQTTTNLEERTLTEGERLHWLSRYVKSRKLLTRKDRETLQKLVCQAVKALVEDGSATVSGIIRRPNPIIEEIQAALPRYFERFKKGFREPEEFSARLGDFDGEKLESLFGTSEPDVDTVAAKCLEHITVSIEEGKAFDLSDYCVPAHDLLMIGNTEWERCEQEDKVFDWKDAVYILHPRALWLTEVTLNTGLVLHVSYMVFPLTAEHDGVQERDVTDSDNVAGPVSMDEANCVPVVTLIREMGIPDAIFQDQLLSDASITLEKRINRAPGSIIDKADDWLWCGIDEQSDDEADEWAWNYFGQQ
jgi:hypothetical protein